MKTSLTYLKNHLICFGAVVLLLTSAAAAKAQVLLDVYISGNVVTITSSGALMENSTATATLDQGIDLLNFFNNYPTFDNPLGLISSTLTTGDGSAGVLTFNTAATDDYGNGSFDNDLNLYGSSAPETFTTGTLAFSGTLTLDLTGTGEAGALPAVGTSGAIITGYNTSPDSGQSVGTWQVLAAPSVSAPEPSTWLLLLLGVAALAMGRKRLAWLKTFAAARGGR